jgi:hypothetical protein
VNQGGKNEVKALMKQAVLEGSLLGMLFPSYRINKQDFGDVGDEFPGIV